MFLKIREDNLFIAIDKIWKCLDYKDTKFDPKQEGKMIDASSVNSIDKKIRRESFQYITLNVGLI